MAQRAFVVMQVGNKDSPERQRADEIYNYIVVPCLKEYDLEPYRADLDVAPGSITPKLLSELVSARVVIADLTGRNPNVFYELGITHSFARPLICIAESAQSLPFDTKDERIISLGQYSSEAGLSYAQGESAKASLSQSLQVVLDDLYQAPSPLRDVAGAQSLATMAPDNPIAAEIALIREAIEELSVASARRVGTLADKQAFRDQVTQWLASGVLSVEQVADLVQADTSGDHDVWVRAAIARSQPQQSQFGRDPWAPAATVDEAPF